MTLLHRPGDDSDLGDRAQRMRILPYCFIGLAFGGAIGAKLAGIPGLVVGMPAGFFFMYWTINSIVEGSGRAAASLYVPSGSSTPAVREYSLAQSLIMREQYEAAVAQLESDAADNADDPTPLVILARLARDRLHDNARAVAAFRRALRAATADTGLQHQLLRELVEICEHRLREPARALPDLARFADAHPTSAGGQWARAELKRLKTVVAGG